MPHKLRKTRKNRGTRTQGYGRIGQHRDAGSKGYRKVGMHKHRWSLAANMPTPYFGKHGFHSPQKIHQKQKTINLNQLTDIAQNQTTINLTQLGYTKLLGTGKITKLLNINVPTASKTAQQKIKQQGGTITLTQTQPTPEH